MDWKPHLRISYYIHAWQGILMFLAGIVSVLAAFTGYLVTGGAEQLLRGAMANVDARGNISFRDQTLDWRKGELIVTNLSRADYALTKNGPDLLSGLEADKVRLSLDLFPWPPNVRNLTVQGMHKTALTLTQGFLQSGNLWQPKGPPFPVTFQDCDLLLQIGDIAPLQLSGCSGELHAGEHDEIRGAFSLSKLNGKPFNLKLEALEDGRWLLTGENIQLNTHDVVASGASFGDKLDPVGLLVRSLFSGEMGAEGVVSSLRISVQPATATRGFICDGEVGYKNIEFHLPPPEKEGGRALPHFLDQLLGAEKDESIWPRWMQVDRIRTGKNGRVQFHMAENRLNFNTDAGVDSSFTGSRGTTTFPPVESLNGFVETDDQGRPRKLVVNGFLGDELGFQTSTSREIDGSRSYEMLLEPRGGDANKLNFHQSMWRFKSVVKDYFVVSPKIVSERNLPFAEFEIEGDARHFPKPEWLPAGMLNVSGHMYGKGRFTRDLLLHLDTVSLDDGAGISYGAAPLPPEELNANFGPLWQGLLTLFGTDTPWQLRDLSLHGEADVQFSADPKLHVKSTTVKNVKVETGILEYANRTTDLGAAGVRMNAQHDQNGTTPFASNIEINVGHPELGWNVKLKGDWTHDEGKLPRGNFTLTEENIPFLLHPQHEIIEARFVSEDRRRINRTTLVTIEDGKSEHQTKP